MLNCSQLRLLLVEIHSRHGEPENTEPQSADPHLLYSILWHSLRTTPDRPLPDPLHGPPPKKK